MRLVQNIGQATFRLISLRLTIDFFEQKASSSPSGTVTKATCNKRWSQRQMTKNQVDDPGYPDPGKLELIWGEGFLSPGGPAEVARIVGAHDLSGRRILDIGSGMGGADIALIESHGAKSVVGIDVAEQLVVGATARAERLGLGGRIRYQLVAPGPLPFATASFEAVFSKDAIIHVHEKISLYAEIFRVLVPGGLILISDWLRGDGQQYDRDVEGFILASGHTFALASLRQIGEICKTVGFKEIELVDRRDWYIEESQLELEKLRGPLGKAFRARWGDEAADDEIKFWEVLVASVRSGAIRPGHIRGRKPSS
jgi:phosphoethanolamine N-methyltransferase